ncbi:MAG: hypothetical protein DKT66_09420 [Candidatus Melainabacteria bacterium]|nr:MAG: hypothetical protein DKT66_09420 [Candidatus Melainabacteria bacterium]
MKSYIVPNLDANDKQMLHDHGVVYYPWDDVSIIIGEAHLQQALKLLGATASEKETEYEGFYQLTLAFTPVATAAANTSLRGRQYDATMLASRARYIELCSARLGDMAKQAVAKINSRKQKLGPAQEVFVKNARHHFVGSTNLPEDALKQRFSDEYDRLMAVDKVKAVRVTNGALLVFTETLVATHPKFGKRHELGEFMIVIRTDGLDDGVKWFNSTRRVRTVQPGMNAPRVYPDGTACIDEIKETLLELIAQFEFATVAELAIQFVETVGEDDMSKFIDKWPLARA